MRTWLKEIRERGGRPQEAAKESGISVSYYCQIENGKRDCPVPTAKKLLRLWALRGKNFTRRKHEEKEKAPRGAG